MVNINGVIGNGKGEISLLSVIDQVQQETEPTIHVTIDSIVGDLDVAISIYDYLTKLPKQVIIECSGNHLSAASALFLFKNKIE